jgi:hypothetical protein
MRIAAVVVAHGDAPFLASTLDSITGQSRTPDSRIAVCDATSPQVDALLRRHGFNIHRATTTSRDVTTRIAHNFAQGVHAVSDFDLAVLGDHDDIWHIDRIGHLEAVARTFPEAVMLASDGRSVDTNGTPLGGTVRDTFPVPAGWNDLNLRKQWTYVLRHSVATGGASAVVPHRVLRVPVPKGWLHDRWWSMLAVRDHGMVIDDAVVIDYRISDDQRVGLDTQGQESTPQWVGSRVTSLTRTTKRAADIARLLV